MRITKLGHSCLLVEDADTRLLLDPGVFSTGFETLTGLAGVLVTHQHVDHLDPNRLRPLLDANPSARLIADPDTAAQLRESSYDVEVIDGGDTLTVGEIEVRGVGDWHAIIHPDLPRVRNVGLFLGEKLFHPGDALTVPDHEVQVLAIPAVAPWSKVAETVEYLRAVAPATAFPIHDASTTAHAMYDGHLTNLGPERTTYRRIDAEPLTV